MRCSKSRLSYRQDIRKKIGIRLGNMDQVREVILSELERIFKGEQSVKAGLDDAVIRGNAILKEFGVTHQSWPGSI